MTAEDGGSGWTVRPLEVRDLDALAVLWHDAWHDAHGHCVQPELLAQRPVESFVKRMPGFMGRAYVVEDGGAALAGWVGWTVEDGKAELEQMFVAAPYRGRGLAARLMTAGEAAIARLGFAQAWLMCVTGNERARRFYIKAGWQETRHEHDEVVVDGHAFQVNCHIFEKRLAPR